MGEKPLVSIIVPVYNRKKTIEICIASILKAEFKDFEVLLIDDGSTDATKFICEKIAGQDKRIRFFHKENVGVAAARNMGLSKAKENG